MYAGAACCIEVQSGSVCDLSIGTHLPELSGRVQRAVYIRHEARILELSKLSGGFVAR